MHTSPGPNIPRACTIHTCSTGLGPHPHAMAHLGLVPAGAALGKVPKGVEERRKGFQRVAATATATDSDRIAGVSTATAAAAAAEEGDDRHGVNGAIAKGRAADGGGMIGNGRESTAVLVSLRATWEVVRCTTSLAGGVAGAAAAAVGVRMPAGSRAGPVHRAGRTGIEGIARHLSFQSRERSRLWLDQPHVLFTTP